MSSCNAAPVRWAINPVSTRDWAQERSCNAGAFKRSDCLEISTGCADEYSCNARRRDDSLRAYPGWAARQARTRATCSEPRK